MTTLSGLRSGLATRLATITGLRTSSFVPDDPKPPIAVIIPSSVSYDTTFGRGEDEYDFTILLLVSKVSDRNAQASMDAYCNPSGASSIKAAVEGDRTLGGTAFDCRVTEMRNYRQITVGDEGTQYLSAEFAVHVIAQ